MTFMFRPNRLPVYDDRSILGEIKRVIINYFHGACPTKKEFDKYSMVKSWAIRKRFGSWAQAVRRAGFEYKGRNYENLDLRREKYTRELMVADLERVKRLNAGRYFSQAYYIDNGGKYSVKTLKAYFDCSWSTLLREHLSLVPTTTVRLKIRSAREVKRYVDVTEQSLFKEIKRVWDALGRRPSYSEFKRMSSIGISVYEHRFGNWKSAIARFYSQNSQGLIGLAGSHATPHLLLTELRRIVCESRSHILTYNNYRSFGGTYSIGAFQAHFGSWQAAVEKIGYLDGHSSQFKDEELFSELQRLWEMYGRQPTYKEMDKVGKVSGGVFQRRFGSWMKAIHAFCQDRASFDDGNGHEEGDSPEVPPVVDTKATPPLVGSTPISETASIEPVRALENSILVDARRNPGKRLRWRIFEKDSFQCVVCGRGPRNHPGTVLHIDHIIPWASGGLTIFENLQTLCFDCNLGKSDRFAE